MDETIFKAVAATAMSAVAWTPHAKTDETDSYRRHQVNRIKARSIEIAAFDTMPARDELTR
jgi:hypothetical protein